MSQSSPVALSRRLFLRNSGTAVLSGAAVALLADREALAQSETMSQVNLHDSAPTQFKELGDVRLAYRQFGKEGAPPLVCLQALPFQGSDHVGWAHAPLLTHQYFQGSLYEENNWDHHSAPG